MSCHAVLFDLDDTLHDRRATVDRYLEGYAKRRGLTAAVAAKLRDRFHALDGAGYTPRSTVFEGLAAEFAVCGDANQLNDDWLTHAWSECRYIDGATDLLAWCRQAGFKTGIVTNGRSAYQRAKLDSLGVTSLVDVVLVSGEEGMHKPDPVLFRRAAERLGVAPEECVFVGDNPHADITGALAAGMHAIWFQRELPWPSDLPRPEHSVRDLAALRDLLHRART
jgi:putative hydrolase of the HAD superfamily